MPPAKAHRRRGEQAFAIEFALFWHTPQGRAGGIEGILVGVEDPGVLAGLQNASIFLGAEIIVMVVNAAGRAVARTLPEDQIPAIGSLDRGDVGGRPDAARSLRPDLCDLDELQLDQGNRARGVWNL
jgi:hypothetical protein